MIIEKTSTVCTTISAEYGEIEFTENAHHESTNTSTGEVFDEYTNYTNNKSFYDEDHNLIRTLKIKSSDTGLKHEVESFYENINDMALTKKAVFKYRDSAFRDHVSEYEYHENGNIKSIETDYSDSKTVEIYNRYGDPIRSVETTKATGARCVKEYNTVHEERDDYIEMSSIVNFDPVNNEKDDKKPLKVKVTTKVYFYNDIDHPYKEKFVIYDFGDAAADDNRIFELKLGFISPITGDEHTLLYAVQRFGKDNVLTLKFKYKTLEENSLESIKLFKDYDLLYTFYYVTEINDPYSVLVEKHKEVIRYQKPVSGGRYRYDNITKEIVITDSTYDNGRMIYTKVTGNDNDSEASVTLNAMANTYNVWKNDFKSFEVIDDHMMTTLYTDSNGRVIKSTHSEDDKVSVTRTLQYETFSNKLCVTLDEIREKAIDGSYDKVSLFGYNNKGELVSYTAQYSEYKKEELGDGKTKLKSKSEFIKYFDDGRRIEVPGLTNISSK